MELLSKHFAAFFRTVHGYDPYPWQQALINQLADRDLWPDLLDLPTGSGKTATLDAAVFHLAMRSNTLDKTAIRIVFVVDRRLVVDDTYARAKKISCALDHSLQEKAGEDGVLREVAQRLNALTGKRRRPLAVQRLRGGAPLENDWAGTPTQPTILCSTVDQVGSRLLFRGYGISDRMKPVHAGLLGTNSLILLDEVHLAKPFRQTIDSICKIGKASIRTSFLSATSGFRAERPLELSSADRTDVGLKMRLKASKPAQLIKFHQRTHNKQPNSNLVAKKFAKEAIHMAERLRGQDVAPMVVGIVVNRVALARDIFKELESNRNADKILMIGPSRSVDREDLVDKIAPFRTGEDARVKAKPLLIVATQCLEVGIDIDLDGLVTQAASLDALRQRFGRLNRGGRPIGALGTILVLEEDLKKKKADPVYGNSIPHTWQELQNIAKGKVVDFGIDALPKLLTDAGVDMNDLASEPSDAPVIMPAYFDLWSQTCPRPKAEPEISLFLHGERTTAGVSIVWRSDISQDDLTDEEDVVREAIRLVPPRAAEAIEVPVWTVRKWLRGSAEAGSDISDAPERENPEYLSEIIRGKPAFRWAGYDDPATGFVHANDLRTGDLLVVPAEYGGCDNFGWNPGSDAPVVDVADRASKPYWSQRCAVRVTRDIVCEQEQNQWNRIADVLLGEHVNGHDLVEKLLATLPSEEPDGDEGCSLPSRKIRESLEALRHTKGGHIKIRNPYGEEGKRGAILVAERGLAERNLENRAGPGDVPATEGDSSSHSFRNPAYLDKHGDRVKSYAMEFVDLLGLGDVKDDIGLAALLHDAGKADPRFQTMLAGGDPWNQPESPPLAKSRQSWFPQAWERSGLPKGWRHEALSVRMALEHPQLSEAHDPALVLWLIGSHHGYGRPFFHFSDTEPEQPVSCLGIDKWQLPADRAGPQSLAFDFNGADWPFLYEDLKRRYGIWGLAHLEAVLRLADHRASEEECVT